MPSRNATWSYRLRLAWERRKLATSETWLRLWGIDGEILPPSHPDGEHRTGPQDSTRLLDR